MTASRPNLRVAEVGGGAIEALCGSSGMSPQDGGVMVLVEVRPDVSATLWIGHERDLCTPGFVADVAFELAHAGVRQAGGPGVAALAHRERVACSKANRLAQSVVDIGKVLTDMAGDIRGIDADALQMATVMNRALYAVSEIVESCGPDVCGVEPGKAAREALAVHGWREGMFPARPGKRPHNWVHTSLYGYAWIGDGLISLDASVQPPAVLRAFAALAEETQP
jgi:hypothetical protein